MAIAILTLLSGCAASHTAYRAKLEAGTGAEAQRECVANCSNNGGDVHACLAACPGFQKYPGDRCTPGREAWSSLCVTVEDRIVPDMDFWGAVASTAVDAAVDSADDDDDDDDDDKSSSKSSSQSASKSREKPRSEAKVRHAPASAKASPSRRPSDRPKRR